jgi:hypothetical protein
METQVFGFILASARLLVFNVDLLTAFGSIVFLVGLIATSYFFFFTLSPKVAGRLSWLATIGRYMLMIYFGARFGATVLSRVSLFLGRLQFLLFDWLGL